LCAYIKNAHYGVVTTPRLNPVAPAALIPSNTIFDNSSLVGLVSLPTKTVPLSYYIYMFSIASDL
jgi:hypothetical protein